VGYPFLQEAKVVKVSDELFDYVLPENGPSTAPVTIPHGPKDIEAFKKRADRIENTYSKRLGMIIGQVETLLHVEMLKGLKKTDEGATVKEYAEIPGMEAEYATQTVVDTVISEDPRFLEKEAIPIEEEFPEGSRAFYLGDFAYGRPLQVLSHADNKTTIIVSKLRKPEPEFGREVARRAEQMTPYFPSYVVARRLNMPPLALSKITSTFRVNSSGLTLNLGLNLKFEAKKQKVLGYSRKPQNGWEYSQKAVELLAQYMVKFPEFIAGIINNPSGDGWEDTDFYPKEIAKQKVKEIVAWLKEIESKSFERVPLDADQLDSDAVKLVEQAADQNLPLTADTEMKKIGKVPRSALLKPSDAEHRLSNQTFSIGDRIVYVQDSGRVPIGAMGIVVGKTRTARTMLLDIVFDTTFMSGTSLGDRCSPFRGSTVPASAVLNLTDKQVISYSTAGAAKRPQTSSQPLTARGIGAPDGPQLVPANAPPPLRGSYRGAFGNGNTNGVARGRGGGMAPRGNAYLQNGDHTTQGPPQPGQQQQLPIHNGPSRGRGGRGGFAPRGQPNGVQNENHTPAHHPRGNLRGGNLRGGNSDYVPRGRGGRGGGGFAPNRGGFTITDMNDPTAGVVENNPDFRPRSYNHVPPPANLNTPRGGFRGRGRGRGGFRGRGGPRGGAAPAAQQ
jgi:5'-3' exoribonuclease 1